MQLFMKLLNTFFGTARLDAHRENARGIALPRGGRISIRFSLLNHTAARTVAFV